MSDVKYKSDHVILYFAPFTASQGLQNEPTHWSMADEALHQHLTSDALQTQWLLSPAYSVHAHIRDSLFFFAGLALAYFSRLTQGASHPGTFPCALTEPAGTHNIILR